jgi:hypothetical protein
MAGNKVLKSTKELTLISLMTTIVFVQEQLLISLPGIQLTVFLLVLFAKRFGFVKSSIIIVLYVILDSLYMGSLSIIYTPFVLLGWMIIPLTLCTIFKKIESPFLLAMLGVLFSFIYSWLYIIPSYLFFNIDPIAYFISDIIFEISLAICSFLTILLLYKPCSKALKSLLK